MRTDWKLIRRAATEIDRRFRGSRVRDAGVLNDGRIAIELWSKGEAVLLCFDAFGTPPLVTVEDTSLAIASEPGFVRALGAALRQTCVLDAQSRTGDRLLRLRFGTRSRFGVTDEVLLYFELVPRFGNLLLVKGDVVVAALKEFSLAENGTRAAEVGRRYELPPLVTRDATDGVVDEEASVLEAFTRWRQERLGKSGRSTEARRVQLRRRLDSRERKLRLELDELDAKRARANERETIRAEGEAIFTTLHERHESERAAAKDRAAALFATYKKLGASLPHIEKRRRSLTDTLQAVEELRWEAERTGDSEFEDVERAAELLDRRIPASGLPPRAKRKRAPLEVRTMHGSRILVGRSPSENADLTFHVARPNDLWFHAQAIPGAHVILQRDDRSAPPDEDVQRAASIAALYSKAKASGKVAIDYTERKHVRAQRDAPPGLVWYTNARTLVVEPDERLEEQP